MQAARRPASRGARRPDGRCCEPVSYAVADRERALRAAAVAGLIGHPIRLQLLDVLRLNDAGVCVEELLPLFEVSQSTLSHHLSRLREAEFVDVEQRGLWSFYSARAERLDELRAWLATWLEAGSAGRRGKGC
jgi:ArsR family transcriptional regulator